MAGSTGQPIVVTANGAVPLSPISITSELIDEQYIQKLLHEYPNLIPLDEIGLSWGPLISLGREVRTSAGPIDNLFISPSGEITIAEAKLWRNPESRRKVVAQVLDYAAALSKLDYERFEAAVLVSSNAASLWELVSAAAPTSADDEARFVDAVSRNLARGSFLLLVVGDGIREDVQSLVGLLGTQPNLGFHLELIELRLHHLGDHLLVVPSVVARTNEVTRAIVEVNTTSDGKVTVNIEAMPDDTAVLSRANRPLPTMAEFLERCEREAGSAWVAHIMALDRTWTEEMGGVSRINESSISLLLPYRGNRDGGLPVLSLHTYGTAKFANLQLSRRQPIFDEAGIDQHLRSLGFGGNKRILYRVGELSPELEASVRTALTHLANGIREFEDHDEMTDS